MTDVPATVTYASVVSRETVGIALTMAALNAPKVMTANIITDPNKEKIWMLVGPEFGKNKGCNAIVVRAQFRLKSVREAFRSHLTDCMKQLEYKPNDADPDLWMKVCTKDTDNGP